MAWRLHKHQWLEFDLPKETHIFIYNSPLAKFDKLYNIKKMMCKSSKFLGLSLSEELPIFPLLVMVSVRVADLVPDGNHHPFSLSLIQRIWKVPREKQRILFLSSTSTLTFPISPTNWAATAILCLFFNPVLFSHFGSLFPRPISKWVIVAHCEYHSLVCTKWQRLIEL